MRRSRRAGTGKKLWRRRLMRGHGVGGVGGDGEDGDGGDGGGC